MSTTTTGRSRVTIAGTAGDPDDRQRAGSDGFYRDPVEGTRHKIVAGDPIPPGADLEDVELAGTGEDAGRIAELESHLGTAEAELEDAKQRISELESHEQRAADLEQRLESTRSELDAARASLAERAGESKAQPGPAEDKSQPAPSKGGKPAPAKPKTGEAK